MASALVQMTAFSRCSQLGDLIMLGMETRLKSFPGSRDDGSKRSNSDGDEEQDRSHVKKRRKQSKPIRISNLDSKTSFHLCGETTSDLDFSQSAEHFLNERVSDVNLNPLLNKDECEGLCTDLDSKDVLSYNQNKNGQSDQLYNSLIPLNLSSIKSPSVDSVPKVSESQSPINKSPSADNSLQQLHSTSNERPKTPVEHDSSFLSQSPSLLLPLIKQTQIQNQISQMTSQVRIFNPEAFCDLCNKEFCNKYFLKTHKANKHGIYSESVSGPALSDPMPSLTFTNYFSNNYEPYENPSAFQFTSMSKNVFNQTSHSVNRPTPKKNQAPQLQLQQQTNLLSLKSTSSGNMRALCNICQREFCNKYFVRRHKLKIHGIIDPASKDGSIADTQENSNISGIITFQDKVDKTTTEVDTSNGHSNHFISSNFDDDIKELSKSVDVNSDKSKENRDTEHECETSPIQIPLPQNISTALENALLFKQTQNEENNKDDLVKDYLASSKLKKQGVVNADAFCDICCKEYCNKYFLRTHKLKSHGILPAEEKKDDTLNLNSSTMAWYQTAPLNLIVGDSLNSKDISNKIYFDAEGEECLCSICGRSFQNQFLLRMHQAYTHPSQYTSEETMKPVNQAIKSMDPSKRQDTNEPDKSQQPYLESCSIVKYKYLKDSGDRENKLITNTEDLQKLQNLISRLNNSNTNESSVCDVCNKDVHHITLFENHILKEHADLLEEIGNITEEDNSSSQSSNYSFKKECPRCQKLFFRPSLFEQHINEIHGDLDMAIDSEIFKESADLKDINTLVETSPMPLSTHSPEEKQSVQTPASSFCEICKKELCNKYFMKTHMQRMHGISIENGAQIGGVVCDICNKELCSKYFLRVHKQNSHGIIDELFLPQLGIDFSRNPSPSGDSALRPTDQADLNNRYFTHFNEVCTICNRRFRSAKWLKAHLLNDHGEEGKDKWRAVLIADSKTNTEENIKEAAMSLDFPTVFGSSYSQLNNLTNSSENTLNGKEVTEQQNAGDKSLLSSSMFSMLLNDKDSESKHYQCSYCPFSTSILAFLFIHERAHMNTKHFQTESDHQYKFSPIGQGMDPKEHYGNNQKLNTLSCQQSLPFSSANQEQSKNENKQFGMKCDGVSSKEQEVQQDQDASKCVVPLHQENLSTQQDPKSNTVSLDQSDPTHNSLVHCIKCGFCTKNMEVYLNHLKNEHPFLEFDQDLPLHLQQMEKTLSNLACSVGIPAAFAVPRVRDQVTMQPFVLEDSEYISNTNNTIDPKSGKTFLSSLVFLPVKEKLKKSVTASFKLTPT